MCGNGVGIGVSVHTPFNRFVLHKVQLKVVFEPIEVGVGRVDHERCELPVVLPWIQQNAACMGLDFELVEQLNTYKIDFTGLDKY